MVRKNNVQQGAALITVLLIFAIASYLVGEMFGRLDEDLRRTSNFIAQDQAYVYARSAEQLAIDVLLQDLKNDYEKDFKVAQDDLLEPWTTSVSFPLEGGGITAQLTDLQSKLNINQLQASGGAVSKTTLVCLLSNFELLEVDQRSLWVDSVLEWLDADNQPQTQGAEDDYYLGLEKPYRAANQRMASISELNLIKGSTRALYEKLRPWLTALPVDTPININTIDPQLLRCIPGIEVDKILEGRQKQGYESVALALQGQSGMQKSGDGGARLNAKDFSVSSQFFLLSVVVTILERKVTLESVIYRPEHSSPQNPIRVISRSRARQYHLPVATPAAS